MPLFEWEKVSRESTEYKACMAVTTGAGAIIGGATGSFVPVAGTVAGYASGAIYGLAAGYLLCPYLAPAVKSKIETGLSLTNIEIRSAAEAMGRYAGVNSASDAVKLVAMTKAIGPRKFLSPVCSNPSLSAKQLLQQA